jgi:FdhE protein
VTQQATALEQLAATDPVAAPLAALQACALAAAAEPGWERAIPQFDAARPDPAAPLLHGARLEVDTERQRALLAALANQLGRLEVPAAAPLAAFLASPACDSLALLQASLIQDDSLIEASAERAGLDPAVLAVVGHLATLPLLAACGRRATERVEAEAWPHGYCPVCAAWPTLAEVRGLSREVVLRCGRCGSGWGFDHWRCPFCGSREQRTQSYFAAEQERESRRALACDGCRGYLKSFATLLPLDHPGLLLRDLESLELDMAAQAQGYRRPAAPGWSLAVRVEPARRRGADPSEGPG